MDGGALGITGQNKENIMPRQPIGKPSKDTARKQVLSNRLEGGTSSKMTPGDYQRDVAAYKANQHKIDAAKKEHRKLSAENLELRHTLADRDARYAEELAVRNSQIDELREGLTSRDAQLEEQGTRLEKLEAALAQLMKKQ